MSNQNFEIFNNLHHQASPLLLNNIWDAASAVIVQNNGAKALATSSASLAWSLGYADGGELPVDTLLSAVERIQRVTKVPLSVDIENGYSDCPNAVANLCRALVDMGVAGINIEDGLQAPSLLMDKIKAIAAATKRQLFINARTDVYLRLLAIDGQAQEMAAERLLKYAECGAHGGFVPGLSNPVEAKQIALATNIPINLMVANLQTALTEFTQTKVARFSVGPSSFLSAYQHLSDNNSPLSFDKMNEYFTK